ncbi:MFS transporter [Streptosporangium lutulentum]
MGLELFGVIGLLAVAVVVFAAWVVAELRSANPLIDMRMMRLPAVWTTNLNALLFGAAMFAVYGFLPQFVQTPTVSGYGFGASITEAGLLMLPMLVTMFVAGVLSGRVERVFSLKAQLATGSAFGVLACAALAAVHGERWQVGVAAGVFGLGIGLAFSSMTNLIVKNVPARQTGAAAGMNANIRTIGGSIGAAVMSSVVTGDLRSNGLPYEAGYTHGFTMLTGLSSPPSRRRSSCPPSGARSTRPAATWRPPGASAWCRRRRGEMTRPIVILFRAPAIPPQGRGRGRDQGLEPTRSAVPRCRVRRRRGSCRRRAGAWSRCRSRPRPECRVRGRRSRRVTGARPCR